MKSKNRIVVSVLASLMLSACSSSDRASDDYCQDIEPNNALQAKEYESLVYAGPTNRVGYQNIYDRYSKLDKLYFEPTFILVEGSLLQGTGVHEADVYPSGNSFDEWIMVQMGKHHTVCTEKYPTCLSKEDLLAFYEKTGSYSSDYDRSKFLADFESADKIQFDFDSAKLSAEAVGEAQEIAKYLMRYPSKRILILGSADSVGEANYNKKLSRRRAESLKNQLIALGIPKKQIIISWKGEYQSGEGAEYRIAELTYE